MANRPYLNVAAFDLSVTPLQLTGLVVVYSKPELGLTFISRNGDSRSMSDSEFAEWHSFSLFSGLELNYMICDDTYQTVQYVRYRIQGGNHV